MLLPGKIAGQSVYLLDDTDIEIVILVSRIFAISTALADIGALIARE